MTFDVIDARLHRPEDYADTFAGYKAVRLLDETGVVQGECVWRLASGQSVEITEFGIYWPENRRRGWGTKLLEASIANMRAFFADKAYELRRIYLFCDSINEPGRAFYEAHGFRAATTLTEFYHYCDAVLYVRDMTAESRAQAPSDALGTNSRARDERGEWRPMPAP